MSLKRGRAALLLPLLLCPALGWAAPLTARQEAAESGALLVEPAPPSHGSPPPAPVGLGQRRSYLLRLKATTEERRQALSASQRLRPCGVRRHEARPCPGARGHRIPSHEW